MAADEEVQYTFVYQHPTTADSGSIPLNVLVTGTFDNWSKSSRPMQQSSADPRRFSTTLKLHRSPTGAPVLFKFVVDGQWVLQQPNSNTASTTTTATSGGGGAAAVPINQYATQTTAEGYVNHALSWSEITAAAAAAAASKSAANANVSTSLSTSNSTAVAVTPGKLMVKEVNSEAGAGKGLPAVREDAIKVTEVKTNKVPTTTTATGITPKPLNTTTTATVTPPKNTTAATTATVAPPKKVVNNEPAVASKKKKRCTIV